MDDREALKIHGYVYSDCDSYSSSSQSDTDDFFAALQPPPIPLQELEEHIVKIKASQDQTSLKSNPWNIPNTQDGTKIVSENYLKHFPPLPKMYSNLKDVDYQQDLVNGMKKVPSFNSKKCSSKKSINGETSKSLKQNVSVKSTTIATKNVPINLVKKQNCKTLTNLKQTCNIGKFKFYSCNDLHPVLEKSVTSIDKLKPKRYNKTNKPSSNHEYIIHKKTEVLTTETFIVPEIQLSNFNNRNSNHQSTNHSTTYKRSVTRTKRAVKTKIRLTPAHKQKLHGSLQLYLKLLRIEIFLLIAVLFCFFW